jgi:hypothetical protein
VPYDVDALDQAVLDDAAVTHPTLQDRRGDRISLSYAPNGALSQYNLPLAMTDIRRVDMFIVTADNLANGRAYAGARSTELGHRRRIDHGPDLLRSGRGLTPRIAARLFPPCPS